MKDKIFFNKTFVNKSDKKYVNKVFRNNKFTDGEFQAKCELLIKRKINSKYIALTQNCTSALEIAMILINIKKGDEVIMPSYTFTSTANAVLLRGGKPVFADIHLNDANLDIDSVRNKINKNTKAIIVVHYGGNACDMSEFLQLKKKHKLFIIEDAAHGFMGKYKNKFLGTIGDIGAFSFHETKNFVGGQCGAISINNKKFVDRTKIILDKGTDRASITNKKKYYSWKDVGSEFRSAELPAALLFSQLKKINKIQGERTKLWKYYLRNLKFKGCKKLKILQINKKNKSAFHVFPIIFNKLKLREKFINFMKKKGILCYFHYYPLHKSSFGRKFKKTNMTNTELIYNGLVRLPFYPGLKIQEAKKVILETNRFIKYHVGL